MFWWDGGGVCVYVCALCMDRGVYMALFFFFYLFFFFGLCVTSVLSN